MRDISIDHILSKIQAVDDDFADNARLSYSIVIDAAAAAAAAEDGGQDEQDEEEEQEQDEENAVVPFKISATDGTLTVHGELDREVRELHRFRIVAEDNAQPPDKRLRSSVKVAVRVSDLNDNAPIFYGYDKLIKYPIGSLVANTTGYNANKNNNNNNYSNDNKSSRKEKEMLVPVYRASVPENGGSGMSVVKVYANDTDLSANGNGMVLFHLPRNLKKSNQQRELFTIDSKDGLVSTLTSLDYEEQSSHEIIVLASDLGNPSLTSTALVIVDVVDIQEHHHVSSELSSPPIFAHRYYEMEVSYI